MERDDLHQRPTQARCPLYTLTSVAGQQGPCVAEPVVSAVAAAAFDVVDLVSHCTYSR